MQKPNQDLTFDLLLSFLTNEGKMVEGTNFRLTHKSVFEEKKFKKLTNAFFLLVDCDLKLQFAFVLAFGCNVMILSYHESIFSFWDLLLSFLN